MHIPVANPILTVHYIIITDKSKQTIKEATYSTYSLYWYTYSGKEIATNSWCGSEPSDHNGLDERDLVMDTTHDFCFRDVPEGWNTHYISKQGMCKLCPVEFWHFSLRRESKSRHVRKYIICFLIIYFIEV